MKKTKLVVVALALAPSLALAADGSAAASVTTPSPWAALVAVAVPASLAVVKRFVPRIPSVWLPVLAPVLGAGADVALHFAGVGSVGPFWAALLGSAGVGLREFQDQVKRFLFKEPLP